MWTDVEAVKLTEAEAEGGPSVLISRRKYASITREEIGAWLAPLWELGTQDDRARALAVALAEELHAVLSLQWYRVDYRGDDRRQFVRDQCADITIWGHGCMWDIEVRNRRSHWHEFALKDQDRRMIERDMGRGIVPVFVIPKCTKAWRAEAEALGVVVIETETYVVADASHKAIWQSYGCEAWPTEIADIAVPRIAEMITSALRISNSPDKRAGAKLENASSRSEVRRAITRHNYRLVWDRLVAMHADGVPSMKAAAEELGVKYRTAKRIVREFGGSPWSRGGAGRGQGRKSKGHSR
jgi:hypothetical protein